MTHPLSENTALSAQEQRQGEAEALEKELADSFRLAETGLAAEKLGGNIVKQEYWKGELAVLHRFRQLLPSPVPAKPAQTLGEPDAVAEITRVLQNPFNKQIVSLFATELASHDLTATDDNYNGIWQWYRDRLIKFLSEYSNAAGAPLVPETSPPAPTLSAQVEGQTGEEIAFQAARECVNVDTAHKSGRDEYVQIILAALRAKSEKEQSSGKKDAPPDDVNAVLQKALALLRMFDADAWFGRPGDIDCIVAESAPGVSGEDRSVLARHVYEMKQHAQDFWDAAQVILSEYRGGSPATSVPASPPTLSPPSEPEKDTERKSSEGSK